MASDRWRPWRIPAIACILGAGATAMATINFGHWLPFTLWAIAAICLFGSVILSFSRIKSNMAFVLDAVENGDFMFRYTKTGRSAPDAYVNSYLNRLIEILEKLTDDIHEKDRYYEVILNSVDTGILVIDDSGSVLLSNLAARRMLRTDALNNIRHLERIDQSFPTLVFGSAQPTSITLQTPSGSITLAVSRARLTLNQSKVTVLALSDISRSIDSKELESWESLTRVLTHEIMNSLTPVISICESLLSDTEAEVDDFRRGLTTVASTGKGLKRFVENYRTFANLPTPRPAPFYAKPFLEMMREICLHQFPESEAKVAINCSPDDLMLYADEQLIRLVVTNILKNAMQAVAEVARPQISIDARLLPDESVKIYISNNGPLIPPEAARQIFLPFYTTKPGGSGIGLSIARRIMSASGGYLSMRTYPRTTFVLTFN